MVSKSMTAAEANEDGYGGFFMHTPNVTHYQITCKSDHGTITHRAVSVAAFGAKALEAVWWGCQTWPQ